MEFQPSIEQEPYQPFQQQPQQQQRERDLGEGFYRSHREDVFKQRKQAAALKAANLYGRDTHSNRSRYGPKRDDFLRAFAQTPRDDRTTAQWKRFKRAMTQIYGPDERDWGDYE